MLKFLPVIGFVAFVGFGVFFWWLFNFGSYFKND